MAEQHEASLLLHEIAGHAAEHPFAQPAVTVAAGDHQVAGETRNAIDNLLATPEVTGPVSLVQPAVFFRYADPGLEALSAGQKLLLRMGPENAAVVKVKLAELRKELMR